MGLYASRTEVNAWEIIVLSSFIYSLLKVWSWFPTSVVHCGVFLILDAWKWTSTKVFVIAKVQPFISCILHSKNMWKGKMILQMMLLSKKQRSQLNPSFIISKRNITHLVVFYFFYWQFQTYNIVKPNFCS